MVEQAAKARKDEAKAELAGLEPGDGISARINGVAVGKATMTAGRQKLTVTDSQALVDWVRRNHPTEIVESVNPAYMKALEATAKSLGAVIDDQGEVVPGVEVTVGEPFVSVRKDKDANGLVAELLTSGRVSLDGLKAIEAAQ
ncbi:hypothetical protein ABW16_21410 [Mycolicibacter heraklionensis]|uniref:Uncharacterized protein n=1 Tax=Mycolicibacter heraklionensis TaxID=512402 RepID=A0ABR5FA49_9MYCO|nr:hypothetical protein ABW16_21410 [Mycolicibacter heraklionensis]